MPADAYKQPACDGMDVSMISRLKELETENNGLKHRYADARMNNEILKEIIEKSSKVWCTQRVSVRDHQDSPTQSKRRICCVICKRWHCSCRVLGTTAVQVCLTEFVLRST